MKTLLIVMFLNFSFYAQDYQHAIPNKNIDSLISNMHFLELANRANLEVAMKISFHINNNGTLEDIRFNTMFKDFFNSADSFFIKKNKTYTQNSKMGICKI